MLSIYDMFRWWQWRQHRRNKNLQGACVPRAAQRYGQRVIRHSEVGYGFKTTGQEQNRSIRYLHPTKRGERDRKRGKSLSMSKWHLVLTKWVFYPHLCLPFLKQTKKKTYRANCQKWLLTTISVLFTSGEIRLNYAGIDRNSAWDWSRLCFMINYALFQSHHRVHINSVRNVFVHFKLAASLFSFLPERCTPSFCLLYSFPCIRQPCHWKCDACSS